MDQNRVVLNVDGLDILEKLHGRGVIIELLEEILAGDSFEKPPRYGRIVGQYFGGGEHGVAVLKGQVE